MNRIKNQQIPEVTCRAKTAGMQLPPLPDEEEEKRAKMRAEYKAFHATQLAERRAKIKASMKGSVGVSMTVLKLQAKAKARAQGKVAAAAAAAAAAGAAAGAAADTDTAAAAAAAAAGAAEAAAVPAAAVPATAEPTAESSGKAALEGYGSDLSDETDGADAAEESDDGLGEDWRLSGWRPPSLPVAEARYAAALFHAGKFRMSEVGVAEMGQMGVGVGLYFSLVEQLSLLFAAMTFLAAPALILNYQGHGLSEEQRDALSFAAFSIGNQGMHPDNLGRLGGCRAASAPAGAPGVDCSGGSVNTWFTTSPRAVSYWLTASDVLYSLLFLLFAHLTKHKMEQQTEEFDVLNVTAADYSVLVSGLPASASRGALWDFFEQFALRAEGGEGAEAGGAKDAQPFPFCRSLQEAKVADEEAAQAAEQADKNAAAMAGPIAEVARIAGDHRARAAAKQHYSAHPLARHYFAKDAAPVAQRVANASTSATHRSVASSFEARLDASLVFGLDEPGGARSGGWVAEVTCARRGGAMLRHLLSLQRRVLDVKSARAAAKQLGASSLGEGQRGEAALKAALMQDGKGQQRKVINRLSAAMRRVQRVEKRLAQAEATTKRMLASGADVKLSQCCGSAFVTFNNEESLHACIAAYKAADQRFFGLGGLLRGCLQPRRLRFPGSDGKGSRALRVCVAPEPSDVLWENLDTSPTARFLRRLLTGLGGVLLLCGSFAVLAASTKAQDVFAQGIPSSSVCGTALSWRGGGEALGAIAAVHRGALTAAALPPAVGGFVREPSLDSLCPSAADGTRYYWLGVAGVSYTNSSAFQASNLLSVKLNNTDASTSLVSRSTSPRPWGLKPMATAALSSLCDSACVSTSVSARLCHPLACLRGWSNATCDGDLFPESMAVGCFCKANLVEAVGALGFWEGMSGVYDGTFVANLSASAATAATPPPDLLCRSFVNDFFWANIAIILAALFIGVVNVLLQHSLSWLARFERHPTLSAEGRSVSQKTFFALFLNTAIIVLVVNAKFGGSPSILAGKHDSFSRGWYADVGVAVSSRPSAPWRSGHPLALIALTLTSSTVTLPRFPPQVTLNMLLNVLLPHLPRIVAYLSGSCRRWRIRRRDARVQARLAQQRSQVVEDSHCQHVPTAVERSMAASQHELDRLFASPDFLLPSRFPVVLNSGAARAMPAACSTLHTAQLSSHARAARPFDPRSVCDDDVLRRCAAAAADCCRGVRPHVQAGQISAAAVLPEAAAV